jgi:hypothetical protein
MNNRIIKVIAFLLILSIYVTLLAVLAPALPIFFLTGLLAWLIIRRPIVYPERIDSDLQLFGAKAGQAIGRLVGVLARTLTDGP